MATDPQRPASLEDHPLSRRTYRIPTPSIAAFRTLVDECLLLYITGALIHGRPRIGKTYAIEFIRRDLERRHPKLSIYKMRCTRSQTPSENSFFSALSRNCLASATVGSAANKPVVHATSAVSKRSVFMTPS